MIDELEPCENDTETGINHNWESIDWGLVMRRIRSGQAELMDLYNNNAHKNIAWIQQEITRSFEARALAVKLTINSRGAGTPGVDHVRWNSNELKYQAIMDLNPVQYHSNPYLRKNIPKLYGGVRQLNIPTLSDRAMQNLHRIVLEPIAECSADEHSYGFRQGRCSHDALAKCSQELEKGAKWVLEGDIKDCFSGLSHDWLLANIPMDHDVLSKILMCDVVEYSGYKVRSITRNEGACQGGPISPVFCNMALDGMRNTVKRIDAEAELIRYADDFIITSRSIKTLQSVLPDIEDFLIKRGLTLSNAKTMISDANDGFDFLGCTIKKTSNGVVIEPQEKSVRRLKKKVLDEIEKHGSSPADIVTKRLDLITRGWSNYYRFYDSEEAFNRIDQSARALLKHYGMPDEIEVNRYKASKTPKIKYMPIVTTKNPFEKKSRRYFKKRQLLIAECSFPWENDCY